MGHFMDISFFAHAEGCGMESLLTDDVTEYSNESNSCCDDQIIIFDGQDHLKISFDKFSFDQQLLFVAFANSRLNLFETCSEGLILNEHYPPPLLVKDIHLLDEVFII